MEKKVFWQHIEHSGSEHLKISKEEGNITAQGVVLFASKEDIHHITYRITMDKNWLTRRVDVQEDENHSYSSSTVWRVSVSSQFGKGGPGNCETPAARGA
ncbi:MULTISPECIES: putative glycolipid-binding domain-containing protein [Pontibacillus]|uniref:Glycolipid-binding domain-containing protein n=1 Tax=Pontibacillus chungwhensis TaxID=265426 RepID=A0ABY8V5L8_9BACI|nr:MULTISPECIES: putative glycolipid-binding domain-containing protein [Pontibacillus]MCD5324558.1 putative glycolipid-binding domain-containing protein [Pontibacillus sp. HN14]WIF99146.1 putative glycolipid-binding domain-containing protein [Pontibacillus chungwhensis]